MDYADFINGVLPGNYNLTKSMELTRFSSSGTLWYTKKFLVLYNTIFLSTKINPEDYFIIFNNNFKRYIYSLDISVQEEASNFFFNGHKKFDNKHVKTFYEFCGIDKNQAAEYFIINEELLAKKYYFSYLMQSGGQSGVKREIKDYLYSQNFNYSYSNIYNIIEKYRKNNRLTLVNNQIINDYVAFLRNERQILYYYGFFHSKSIGANDIEFSSLTPIGELAYTSNAKEFQIIWEHQKLKMTSQPTTVEINNLENLHQIVDISKFSINFSPYLDIFKYLSLYKKISKEEYQYVLSRNNESTNFFKIKDPNINSIRKAIEAKVKSFNRRGDLKSEDFHKELKKYLLGIVNSEKDKDTNPFCVIKDLNIIEISNSERFNLIFTIYSNIDEYKRAYYKKTLDSNMQEMKTYYANRIKGDTIRKNRKSVSDWNLYIGSFDLTILLNLMFLYIKLDLNKINKTLNHEEVIKYIENNFNSLNNILHLSRTEYEAYLYEWNNKKFVELHEDYLVEQIIEDKYLIDSAKDLLYKIKFESNKGKKIADLNTERIRNNILISLLNAYYIKMFDNNLFNNNETNIKCESCNEVTFLKNNNKPYMEFHHIIPFSGKTQGADHYLNLVNLCPNCHTKLHHLHVDQKKKIYSDLDNNNYLKKRITDRMIMLKQNDMLKSYQLEFLLAENAISEEEYEIIERS